MPFDAYDLHVNATDAMSGVASISVMEGGRTLASIAQPEPCDGCPARLDFDYLPGGEDFSRGSITHRFDVVATDFAGNVSPAKSISITVQPPDVDDKIGTGDPSDDGTPASLDDGSDTCSAEPDPDPSGQYCGASDDTSNTTTRQMSLEPQVGQVRPLLTDLTGITLPPLPLPTSKGASKKNAAPAQGLTPLGNGWGISDQNPLARTTYTRPDPNDSTKTRSVDMFDDPYFQATGVRSVRRIVPWDLLASARGGPNIPGLSVLDSGGTTGKLQGPCGVSASPPFNAPARPEIVAEEDAWLTKAHSLGYEVFVSFDLDRSLRDARNPNPSTSCYRPSIDQYRIATNAFLAKYPWIKLYSAWNEPNNSSEPTSHANDLYYNAAFRGEPVGAYSGLKLAGMYYRTLQQSCKAQTPNAASPRVNSLIPLTSVRSGKPTRPSRRM